MYLLSGVIINLIAISTMNTQLDNSCWSIGNDPFDLSWKGMINPSFTNVDIQKYTCLNSCTKSRGVSCIIRSFSWEWYKQFPSSSFQTRFEDEKWGSSPPLIMLLNTFILRMVLFRPTLDYSYIQSSNFQIAPSTSEIA